MSVQNPTARMQRLLSQEIGRNGRTAMISSIPAGSTKPADSILLLSEASKSMHHLLSLANSESHNFTAEVLLREGTGSWNLPITQRRTLEWLQQQGLPTQGVAIQDGSGLDRGNRVTSKLLTALLLRMAQHPYAKNYLASMAVSGQKGTLASYFRGTELEGRFSGKTGTISGVKAMSGVLSTADGPVYVSMISNGSADPVAVMGRVLRLGMGAGHCRQLVY
jgi:D-alanyl-D-alanine carboxypeptidase/D-alanyl-D-alanine-endopeptidase (penicillin-binding protein 4)